MGTDRTIPEHLVHEKYRGRRAELPGAATAGVRKTQPRCSCGSFIRAGKVTCVRCTNARVLKLLRTRVDNLEGQLNKVERQSYERYEAMNNMAMAYRSALQKAWHENAVARGDKNPQLTIVKQWDELQKEIERGE